MTQTSNAINEYLQSTGSRSFRRTATDEKSMAAMKHFALQLARSATKTIDDRRKRAEIKAAVYNHLIPLLNQHAKTQAATHKFYQKLLMMLGGSLLLALAVIALLLKI